MPLCIARITGVPEPPAPPGGAPRYVSAALAGDIPLCWPSVEAILRDNYRDIPVACGNRLAVKSVEVLFCWLWEWRDGRFQRKGWDYKPYRMLYQKSFEIITLVQGKDATRQWKQSLRTSFIQSHWLLSYPQSQGFMRKDKETGQFLWRSSVHRRPGSLLSAAIRSIASCASNIIHKASPTNSLAAGGDFIGFYKV
ncbi:hypothetical protein BDV27DRAFT_159519 [Aspergillus caelatus]|uniref:Uncharacterized protein n=1 Tax=Aspergillus caelatus TaxID=61420 RepID=A0A5N7A0J5_9EURO|nr:uncharacterized protein BDV27DRAFT_159519 [Aspergillus caelatus]KAE8362696.1 hypothetical protein BDV27DRAFT_159519 [Aspergillus caelatus]